MSTFEDNLWTELISRESHHRDHAQSAAARSASDQFPARRDQHSRFQLPSHQSPRQSPEQSLAPPSRRATGLRPARLSLAAAAAAVAIAGTLGLVHSGAPAYAVTTGSDGSTIISLNDLTAIAPANAALAEAGSRVRVVPMTDSCPALDESTLYRGADWDVPVSNPDGSVTVGRVPAGYTLLLALGNYPGAGLGSSFTAPVQDPAPSCLLSPAQDPSQRS